MFQFGLLSNDYINNMNSFNSMHKLDMIPEFEITSKITKINEICSIDIDDNIPNNVNCKYFTNEEVSSLPKIKTPSIFSMLMLTASKIILKTLKQLLLIQT